MIEFSKIVYAISKTTLIRHRYISYWLNRGTTSAIRTASSPKKGTFKGYRHAIVVWVVHYGSTVGHNVKDIFFLPIFLLDIANLT